MASNDFLNQAPAAPPPPGSTSHLVDPYSNGYLTYVTIAIITPVTTLCTPLLKPDFTHMGELHLLTPKTHSRSDPTLHKTQLQQAWLRPRRLHLRASFRRLNRPYGSGCVGHKSRGRHPSMGRHGRHRNTPRPDWQLHRDHVQPIRPPREAVGSSPNP